MFQSRLDGLWAVHFYLQFSFSVKKGGIVYLNYLLMLTNSVLYVNVFCEGFIRLADRWCLCVLDGWHGKLSSNSFANKTVFEKSFFIK